MNAKKSLKKLKKRAGKLNTASAKQLKTIHRTAKVAQRKASDSGARAELKDLSGQVWSAAMTEFSAPLNPLLSWFQEGESLIGLLRPQGSSELPPSPVAPVRQAVSPLRQPFKRPPCSDCRALTGGLCQCAVKQAKR